MMTENMNKPTRKRINKEWGIEEERYRRTAPDAPGARRKFRKRDSLPIIFAIAVMVFVALLGYKSSAIADDSSTNPPVTNNPMLSITNQTTDVTCEYGDSAPLSVEATLSNYTGEYSLSYDWFLSGTSSAPTVPLSSGSFFTAPTDEIGGKSYYCKITASTNEDNPSVITTIDSPSINVTVSKRTLVVTEIDAEDKNYDGTDDADLSITFEGALVDDDIDIDGTAAFEDEKVGTDKVVLVDDTDLEPEGDDEDKYTIAPLTEEQKTLFADINAVQLTVEGAAASNKTYDTTNTATLTGNPVLSDGVISGENVALDTSNVVGTFSDANVGTGKTVTFDGFALIGDENVISNYTLTQPTTTADITAKSITIDSITIGGSYSYTGRKIEPPASSITVNADIDGTVGLLAPEYYEIEYGDNDTVGTTAGSVTIKQKSANPNYVFDDEEERFAIAAGDLSKAVVRLNWTSREYNGADQVPSIVSITYNGNDISSICTPNTTVAPTVAAGTSKIPGDYSITIRPNGTSNLTGTAIVNYSITKRTVTVTSGIPASDKIYDGTETAELGMISSVSKPSAFGNLVDGDALTASATGHFINVNAGSNRQVAIDSIILGGSNSSYYQLSANGNQTTATANIAPATIIPSVVVTGSYTYTGKAITPTYLVTYAGAEIPSTNYSVTVSDNKNAGEGTITVSPKTGGNYEFNDVSANFTIGRSTSLSPMPKTSITLKSSSSAKTVGDVTMSSLGVSSSKWRWSSADEGKSLVSDTTDSTSTSSSSSTSSNKTTETVTVTARLEYIGSDADNYDDSVKSVEVTITKEGSTASNKTTTTGSRTTTSSSTGTRSSTTSSRTSGSTTSSRTSGSTTSSRTGSSGSSTSSRTGSSSGSSTSSRTGSGSRTSSSSTASGANSAPEVKPPFIAGFPDVSGWDAISLRISGTAKGDSVPVYMNGTTEVPSSLLNNLKDDNVTVVFDMGNSVKWNVNGMCIPEELTSAVNFGVLTNTNTIPAELTKLISATDYNLQLSLAQDGDYGCSPILSLNLGGNNAGLHANLFKYDPATNSLSFVTADEISDDGTASLTFSEGGDYVVVVDKDILANASAHLDKPVATEEDSTPAEDEAEPVSNIAEPDSVTAYVQSQTLEENHVPKSDAIARRMVAPEVKKGVRLFWIMLLAGAAIIGGATYLLMNRQDIKARASARASKKALGKSNKSVKAIQKANNKKFKKYL